MNKIPSKMIEIEGMSDETYISLDSVIRAKEELPIALWGNPTKEKVEEAINYLRRHGGGSIKIPANEIYNLLVIRVMWGRDRNEDADMLVRYEYNDWRPPHNIRNDDGIIVGEYRPYTSDCWTVGDIVYNSDLGKSDNKVVQWYCTVSGVDGNPAGTWKFISEDTSLVNTQFFDYDDTTKTLTVIH